MLGLTIIMCMVTQAISGYTVTTFTGLANLPAGVWAASNNVFMGVDNSNRMFVTTVGNSRAVYTINYVPGATSFSPALRYGKSFTKTHKLFLQRVASGTSWTAIPPRRLFSNCWKSL